MSSKELMPSTRRTIMPNNRKPFWKRIGEISTGWVGDVSRVYGVFGRIRRNFWPSTPVYLGGALDYNTTRTLYRNDDKTKNLGSGFSRRIVNASADFVGLPRPNSGDEIVDEFLSNGIETFWGPTLIRGIRDAIRDGDSILRVRRHDPENPLVSAAEWEACYLEVVPPETVSIYYKQGGDMFEIETAYVRQPMEVVVQPASENGANLMQPVVRAHSVIEEITPETYRYYDETDGKWLDEMQQDNVWGFVPLIEIANEPDEIIGGGVSDLEGPLPFLLAFHDVAAQALVAHKAHAIPKAKFKVNDMMSFIASNWPDSFDLDANGQPDHNSFNGNISWKGTEILFMQADEDVDFLEVKSVSGDSKTLLDFLLTCIAISSETPRSVLMNQTAQDQDEMIPFSQKIDRKRQHFTDPIQRFFKMILAINHMDPIRVKLAWDFITPQIALQWAQVLQQEVMSCEVLATRNVISDDTVRRHVKPYIRGMKPPAQEAKDAKNNVIPGQLAPAGTLKDVVPKQQQSGAPTSTQAITGTQAGNSNQPTVAN